MMMPRSTKPTTAIPRTSDGARRSANPKNNGGDRLLTLLQVTNAAFPTGSFTHSLGFETWIEEGVVRTVAETESRCRDWLRFSLATCDAVAVALSYRDTMHAGMAGLPEIDFHLGALKLGRETGRASLMMGAALVAAGRDIFAVPQIDELSALISAERCKGHQALVYGVLSAGLGISEQEAVTAYLWSGFSSLIGVVQRLVPLGQTDAQRIIKRAGDLVDTCSEVARSRGLSTMSTSYAALDAASMRHERQHARLCIS